MRKSLDIGMHLVRSQNIVDCKMYMYVCIVYHKKRKQKP